MSTSVDNRVVEMRFDNKEFESGIGTSISSLEKLKKSLNLKGAADSFNDIEKASRKLDFNTLGSAVDAINSKFSVLGTISDQILRRIGDAIYNVQAKAVNLVKSLSVDQITEGWQKYADKTESVQTIMAATAKDYIGKTQEEQMAEVNAQLEKLNWFTDETSYNFVDMTSNIGKFTSNGQKLNDSVTAMQGIAVWAAISGANSNEASRAMYNLSQALSVGGVKLIDWKSIENANMSTVEFKETAIATAEALGTLKKKSDGVWETLAGHEVTVKSFNQNLSDMWFNSEVLMSTLNKYGGFTNELNKLYEAINGETEVVTTSQILKYIEDYQNGTLNLGKAAKTTGMDVETLEANLKRLSSSEYELGRKSFKAAQEAKTFQEAINATKDAVSTGWMSTFEYLFGNYLEAKQLWTSLANELWEVFAGGGSERNAMLRDWHEGGGYEKLWQGVSNLWEGLKGIGSKIGEVWAQIFPGLDSDKLLTITDKFLAFSERFRDTFVQIEETVDAVVAPVAETIASVSEQTEKAANVYTRTAEVLDTLVNQVWSGMWGVGGDRRRALEEAGYMYELVQNAVNESVGVSPAYYIDPSWYEEAVTVTEELVESVAETTEVLDEFEETEETVRTTSDDLADVVGGFGSALSILIDVVKIGAKYLAFPALKVGVKIIQKALAFLAPFSRAFTDFVSKMRENNVIEKNIQKIQRWLQRVWRFAQKSEPIQKLLGYLQSFKNVLSGIKDSALEKIQEFFGNASNFNIKLPKAADVADWLGKMAEKINMVIEAIQDGWPKIKEFFGNLDFSGVTEFASSAADTVSQFFQNLFTNDELKETGKGWISSLIDGMIEKVSETDWGNVISIIFKGLTAAVGASIGFGFSDVLFGFGNLAYSASVIPEKIVGILGSVKKVISGYAMGLKADALLKIAYAIGIFAASLIGLSLVPSGKLVTVVGALIPLVGVLIGLAAVIGHFWGNTGTIADQIDGSLLNIKKINVKLPKMALTMGAFAAALLSIVAAVAVFGFMPKEKLEQGLITLAAVVVGLMVVVGIMSKYGGKMENAGAMAKGFIGIAVALDLLIPVITVLTLLAMIKNGKALTGGVLAFLFLLAGMAVALGVLSNTVEDVKGVGGQLILMSLALDLLIPVILVLSLIAAFNPGAMFSAVVAVAILLVAMAGSFWLMSVAISKVRSPKTVIAAMLTMAVGVVAVAAALRLLSGQKFGDMMKAVGAIAILIVALGALGAVAGFVPQVAMGMLAIGAAVTLLGAGLALAGLGAIAFAKALQILADSSVDAKEAGKNLAEGIVGFFDVLMEKGQSIAQFVALIIGVVLAVIIAHKAKMVTTMVSVVESLAKALSSGKTLGIILTAIGVLLAGLLGWLGEKFASLASSIVSLVLILLASVVKGILDNLPMIRELITALLQTIGLVIMNVLTAVFGSILDPIANAMPESKFGKFWNGLKEGLDGAANNIAADVDKTLAELQANVDKQAEELKSSGDKVAEAIESADSAIDTAAAHREQRALSGVLPVSAEEITAESNAVATAATTGSESVSAGFDQLKSVILDNGGTMEEATAAFSEGGENAVLGYVNKLLDGTDQAGEAASLFGDASITSLFESIQSNSPSKLTEQAGQFYAEGFALGISEFSWRVYAPVAKMASIALSALSNIGTRAYTYGYYFDRGLANGISAYSYLVSSKVKNMAQDALNSLATTIESQSPSKATERYGRFFDQGFAVGITKNVGEIDAAVDDAGSNALNGIKAVITRIIDAINGDFDTSVTITPVLDLSNVQNGAYRIGEILNPGRVNYGLQMAGLAANTMNANRQAVTQRPAENREITNNFYVQNMDDAHIEYFIQRVNREIGQRV